MQKNSEIPKTGAELISNERARQIEIKGFDGTHDDRYQDGQLVEAALCYGIVASAQARGATPDEFTYSIMEGGEAGATWPWGTTYWKPEDQIHNLVIAGALIAAEIDRLQRVNKSPIGEPKTLIIDVRYANGTYNARCSEPRVKATCTMGKEHAAEACAKKVFGNTPFTVRQYAAAGDGARFTATLNVH